jgi:hypothetical protein
LFQQRHWHAFFLDREETARLAGEAPQSDDVTLLMLRFKGAGNHAA